MFPKKKDNHKSENIEPDSAQGTTPGEQKTDSEGPKTEELQKQLEEFKKQVETLQKEKADMFAKLQRVAADYDNYQKRSMKQAGDSIAYEKDKIIKAILPVMDDFERVLQHSENADAVIKGIELVHEHLKNVLKSQGVEEIPANGEQFDPAHHQAITQAAVDGKEDGAVLEELQKGYKLNGRVIRASRVVVNKVNAPTEPKQQAEEQEEETKDTQ